MSKHCASSLGLSVLMCLQYRHLPLRPVHDRCTVSMFCDHILVPSVHSVCVPYQPPRCSSIHVNEPPPAPGGTARSHHHRPRMPPRRPPPFFPLFKLLLNAPSPKPSRTRFRPSVPSKPSTIPPKPSPDSLPNISSLTFNREGGEPTHQSADQVQHPYQQQANGSDDLEKGFAKETPERIQLLLGVRHVLKLSFSILNALRDIAG